LHLQNIEKYGKKYGRLLTQDGHVISSEWIKRDTSKSRNNYSIQVILLLLLDLFFKIKKILTKNFVINKARRTVDKFAHRPNVPSELIFTQIYGKVIYYLVHKYEDKIKMLAYLQLTSKVITDRYGCKYFTQFSSFEFIDVRLIDHCVGFMKINSKYYIIDRENEVDDNEIENMI
jgi:hypothetical protein